MSHVKISKLKSEMSYLCKPIWIIKCWIL